VFTAAGTVCRASAGTCDPQETCTGASAPCPADALTAAGTVCRASAGVCDVAETCTGVSAACPANVFSAAGVICRAGINACDPAEACTGAAAACPTDVIFSNVLSATISSSAASACKGANITVSFTITAATASTFQVELSNASGSFAAPTVIGSYTPGATGLINLIVTIPAGSTLSAGYKIRVTGGGCVTNSVSLNINC